MMLDHQLKYLGIQISFILHQNKIFDVFRKFNQVDAQFSKGTLNRAATCIQRWWKGFIIRHRWNSLKQEVRILYFL